MAKILLVEDDKLLQQIYQDTLTGEGYEVTTADDGEQAQNLIKQGGWDLVLLDIILPKINGLDVMAQMKNQPPATPNKAVVFLTNLDKGEEIKKALEYGNGYLIKSQITPGDLASEVKLYLSGQQTQR